MTGRFELRCAQPQRLADCLHDELVLLLAHQPAFIVYGALGGIYLEDIGDDPERADEWDVGDEKWLDRAGLVYRKITTLAPSSPVRLTRRQRRWKVTPEPEVSRDMLSALASFGTDPILWTTLSDSRRFANDTDLAAAIEHVPWWIAHGYKEPFLAIRMGESIESLARVLDAAVDESPFCPHRLRAHEKGARR